MRQSNRRSDPGTWDPATVVALVAVLLVIFVGGSVYLAVLLGHRMAGTGDDLPRNPFEVIFGLIGGQVTWPDAAGWILGALGGVIVLLLIAGIWIAVGSRKRRSRVDHASSYLGTRADLASVNRRGARSTAKRLGVDGTPGVPIGMTVKTHEPLFGSWEDMHIDIWGPRTGKTTSRAVPAVLEAPGAAVVTSNKRDIVDATRDPRAAKGEVWVFDPQRIALEEPTWWWNPLSYVTDEVKAAQLAGHFGAGSKEPGARVDAHFDPQGESLLACYFLAAALGGFPITQVWTWLNRPADEAAVDILRDHDVPMTAEQLSGIMSTPDKERGSIYSTARRMAACLTNRQITAWITADTSPRRPQFDPTSFVRSAGTLYSLSKEGSGSAGPLVTAMTVAVVEAAEELAVLTGGRLSTPLVGVLDEAANVCRWRDLPSLYSHYGSRGIILMTILQSWSQGVEVWGEPGMKKLWSASNVKVYGGGVSEAAFLEDLSRLIGDRDKLAVSTSVGRGARNVSQHLQRERILDVADLAAMPKGRAVVLASGARPTLIRTRPWMTGPHADAVRASIAAHDPSAAATIGDAERELATVSTTDAA